MKYDETNFPKRHILVDANGNKIDNAISCDTETGAVVRLIPNTEPPNEWRTASLHWGCWLDEQPFPAPLRVVPTDSK